jgi:hypothetical protein
MQRQVLKFLVVFIILNFSTPFFAHAQTSHYRLQMADSLFKTKRYTQSLEHYEELLRQHQYSPAMFLKMAYVHEGLNQTGSALYYLNLYYLATKDDAVLEKIDDLATKYDLEGYETSDTGRFWTFYLDNHIYLSIALAVIIVLLLSIMFRTRRRLHTRPIGSAIAVMALCILLFIHQQYGAIRSRAIIAQSSTYLMDGPSAGASVIDIVGDGHRVEVLGKRDVWLKIEWNDEVAYVKENAIRSVRL